MGTKADRNVETRKPDGQGRRRRYRSAVIRELKFDGIGHRIRKWGTTCPRKKNPTLLEVRLSVEAAPSLFCSSTPPYKAVRPHKMQPPPQNGRRHQLSTPHLHHQPCIRACE